MMNKWVNMKVHIFSTLTLLERQLTKAKIKTCIMGFIKLTYIEVKYMII